MKNFWARKQYYVHNFKAIQDWFGNRGIAIGQDDLVEWCYDGHFFYFTCTDTAPDEIKPCDGERNVMVCTLNSICYECDHELDWWDSPFSAKIIT